MSLLYEIYSRYQKSVGSISIIECAPKSMKAPSLSSREERSGKEESGWRVITRNRMLRYSALRMGFECDAVNVVVSVGRGEPAKLNAVNRDPVNRPFPCQEVRQAARLMGLMIHRGLTS